MTFYKILDASARSCNGGDYDYSPFLPTSEPGAWLPEVKGVLRICERGWHVTAEPAKWWQSGARCFEVETDGEHTELHDGDKIACHKIRLLREITDHAELAKLNVFLSGEGHVVETGTAWIGGHATVQYVGGNATVQYVDDNATVLHVRDNATVLHVRDNATVQSVRGNATVQSVRGNATVQYLGGHATVLHVGGNATVQYVGGHATVLHVGGNATVQASDSAVVCTPQHAWGAPAVTVTGHAVWIDRRSGKPVIHARTASGAVLQLQDGAQ